jgi:mycothiol maleylpyruvate isomerase-like protein
VSRVGYTVELEQGRSACSESIHAFLRAVESLSEYDLFGASRCHGWSRLDVVVHVIAGWHDMLGGLVSLVTSEPSVDAASYWSAFAAEYATDDPVLGLMTQRRRTGTYARPAAVSDQLRDVAAALLRGVDGFPNKSCLWQGHVFAPGDFLAVWAVEDVVHHLDLLSEEPPPASALGLARTTIEVLVEAPMPSSLSDQEAVLIGTGRLPVPDDLSSLASPLPALG